MLTKLSKHCVCSYYEQQLWISFVYFIIPPRPLKFLVCKIDQFDLLGQRKINLNRANNECKATVNTMTLLV